MSRISDSYDVVVVGAGTAGSVVAARLSEDPSVRVLVLEAGPHIASAATANPAEWIALLPTSANWGDHTVVQAATGTAPLIGRGRMVGGSSATNAMLLARGHRDSYAPWASAGAKGWTFDDLLPYFKRSETASHGDPALRGTNGPIVVAPANPLSEIHADLLEAAVQRGHHRAQDISSGLELGVGPVDLAIVDGTRFSAVDGYLQPALGRDNFDLVADALVRRVVIAGGRCVGLEYSTTGTVIRVETGEVVVCAGAIGSPQLLMLSGIGPAAHLREVGIEVVADLPGVGSNLQDHPITGVSYRAHRPIPQGTRNHSEAIGLFRTDAAQTPAPDLQLTFVDTAALAGINVPNSFLITVAALLPHSRGTVRLAAPAPDILPLVDPNYLGDDLDMHTMIEGFRIARDIATSPALRCWGATEVAPGTEMTEDESLRAFIRQSVVSYCHPVGTCAMGDTAQSVVDNDLKVHGISGLRIVDASVMPTLPSNNPMATVYAIAERGAELIGQR